MHKLRIAILMFSLFMSAATASADIINPFGLYGSHLRYSSIQLTVANVPKGLVLVLLEKKGELLQIAHSDKMITVSGESILYLAVEDKLSKPFNYRKDEKKLFKLIQFRKEDIPSSSGAPPNPVALRCTVKTARPQNYSLECAAIQRKVSR